MTLDQDTDKEERPAETKGNRLNQTRPRKRRWTKRGTGGQKGPDNHLPVSLARNGQSNVKYGRASLDTASN